MVTVSIKDNLFKSISKIAKKENKTEEAVINESLEIIIKEKETMEEKLKYPEGIPLKVVAAEFGQTEEELRKELDESMESEGIKLDVDELEKRYSS